MVAKVVQHNHASATKVKTPTKDTVAEPTKLEKHPSGKQSEDDNKTTQIKVKAISASHITEFETDSDSEQESVSGTARYRHNAKYGES